MKSQIVSSGRDLSVDFAKGMLMWCVVYGQMVDALLGGMCHATVWLHVFVRTFDLPFFMVLSGYFLKNSMPPQCVVNLVGYVIAPLFAFIFIALVGSLVKTIKGYRFLKYAFGFKVK